MGTASCPRRTLESVFASRVSNIRGVMRPRGYDKQCQCWHRIKYEKKCKSICFMCILEIVLYVEHSIRGVGYVFLKARAYS